jgi:hypothetical protein
VYEDHRRSTGLACLGDPESYTIGVNQPLLQRVVLSVGKSAEAIYALTLEHQSIEPDNYRARETYLCTIESSNYEYQSSSIRRISCDRLGEPAMGTGRRRNGFPLKDVTLRLSACHASQITFDDGT